jgi:hypothetical protein
LGATINITIRGALRLKPILILSADISLLEASDTGMTMKAIFAAKPPATRLNIRAI